MPPRCPSRAPAVQLSPNPSRTPTQGAYVLRARGWARRVQVPSSGDGEVAAVDLRSNGPYIHRCHIHVLLPIPNPKPEPSPLLPYPVATADVAAMPKFSDLCDSALALDAYFSFVFCIVLCRVCRNIIKNCRSGKQGDMAGTWRAQDGALFLHMLIPGMPSMEPHPIKSPSLALFNRLHEP
jgi:hypothetical protein